MKKLLTCLLLFTVFEAFAQKGQEYFSQGDYFNAARYLEVEAPKNKSLYLDLAKSYFSLKEFDKALDAMVKYKEASGADLSYANNFIEIVGRNEERIEKINVAAINSGSREILPVIATDGQTIYFDGDGRQGGPGGDDVWYARKNADGTWGTPSPMAEFNTTSNEGILSMSGDGNIMLVFGNYKGQFGGGDIFYSVKTKDGWSAPCNLGGTINTSNWESMSNISVDGKTIIFCSDRTGGVGGSSDLWITHLTENGWTTPANLGGSVNTTKKDFSPFLAADGKTLYFASDGHPGFGGADLFVTRRTGESWTEWTTPVNLGKYINTLKDDYGLTMAASGIRAYLSGSGQLENNGTDDIYEFILPSTMRPERLINVVGTVSKEDTSPAGVIIRYIDHADGKEIAKTISAAETGKYGVSLPANKLYDVVIDMKGFLYYETQLDLTDPAKYMKQEPFSAKIVDEYSRLSTSSNVLISNGQKVSDHINSNSFEIEEQFLGLEELFKSYRSEISSMEELLKQARYRWLTEAERLSEVEQNHQLQEIKVGASFEIENLFFDVAKASLRPESKATLDQLYGIMSKSEMVVEFGGHTDDTGSDDANMKLSQDRVNSVVSYLAEKGIDPNRMNAVGYGETTPIADNTTEDGRQKNRRVELKITQLRLQREGSGEISAEEEYDRIREQEQKLLAANDPEELLSNLRNAAMVGGLPPNSPCSTAITVASNTSDADEEAFKSKRRKKDKKVKEKKQRTRLAKTRKSKRSNDYVASDDTQSSQYSDQSSNNTQSYEQSSSGNSSSLDIFDVDVDIDEYIYKSFNPALYTYGTHEYGGSAGVGANFVKKKNLREFYMKYHFANPDNVKGIANLGWLWAFPLANIADNPLLFHAGIDYNLMIVNNPLDNTTDTRSYFNLPLGFRYIMNFGDLVVGPQIMYNIQLAASDDVKNYLGGSKSSYIDLGVNARWKIFQGGIFYNAGDYVKYTGLRAGLSF